MRDLLVTLQSMVSAEGLTMTWISGDQERLADDTNHGHAQFGLPRLTSLKLVVIGGDYDEDSYAGSQRFLELFRTATLPSLIHLGLLLRAISQDAFTDILESLILLHGHTRIMAADR